MRFVPNQKVGRYQIVDGVAKGGMGEVYRARQDTINRIVAIKVMLSATGSADFSQRFLNEARIHAKFHHPNIVTFYDFFDYQGTPCIVMEYVGGRSLDQLISEHGKFSVPQAIKIFSQIVNAIGYIHGHGVLHRDIKPSNIKIETDGNVKLLDFGVAKEMGSHRLTQTGNIIGTLQYLAPEQLSGNKGDQRSDIWALGILFYEMITGHLPFKESSLTHFLNEIRSKNFSKRLVQTSNLPDAVNHIINTCLQSNPMHRYRNIQQLERDLALLNTQKNLPHFAKKDSFQLTHKTLRLIQILAIVAPLVVVSLLIIFAKSDSKQQPIVTAEPVLETASENLAHVPVRIGIRGNNPVAKIYDAQGQSLGETPFEMKAPIGAQLEYVIRSEGYHDKNIAITVRSINNNEVIDLVRD